ncbi:transmembrane protein 120 homolog [Condylostylus longicornis]|uniref:transmembrane protein 120 homolog n=1 Tax=Condylostylus longicornis TaxID=2530218 RepID=UPI00244DFE57|nr:transmembrane protein 120 homolog [Condylostylus longicornis]
MAVDISALSKEVDELNSEYKELEVANQKYVELLEGLYSQQQKCFNEIKHQRYRLGQITSQLAKVKIEKNSKDAETIAELEKNVIKRKAQLHEIEQSLPRKSGFYLQIILGDVNVSILNRNDKVRYKDDYEKFKLVLNVIGLVMAFLNLWLNYRALELAFIFLLVWYYCTLTIRESILKVNGSRIKGWWRAHHFISTVCSGVLLIWPQGETWQLFRHQFMYFNAYISMVQYLQFRYQKGLLYRLKALGERHNMDITIEGFHSWMWRGLSFLLPFLFAGYAFQAYMSYVLYKLSYHPEMTWQIPALSLLFGLLFIGNTTTTLLTLREKIRERVKERYRLMSVSWSMKQRNQIKDEISSSDDQSISSTVNNTPVKTKSSINSTVGTSSEINNSIKSNNVGITNSKIANDVAPTTADANNDEKSTSNIITTKTVDKKTQ